jgi:hypothetical protein
MNKGLPRQCKRFREWLPDYAEGALPEHLREPLDRHLTACTRCTAEVADLGAVIGAVRAVASEEPSENLVPRVRRAVHQQTPAPAGLHRFWARLAVPVAVLTGVIAVSFALRQPSSRQAFVQGRGAIEQKKLAQSAPTKPALDRELAHKPMPETRSGKLGGAVAPASAPTVIEMKPVAPAGPALPARSSERRPPARLRFGRDLDEQPAFGPREPYRGRGGGGGGARGGGARSGRAGWRGEEQVETEQASGTLGAAQPGAPAEAKMRAEKSDAITAMADQVAAPGTPSPPFSATAVLAKGGQGAVIALRISADRPLENFVLKLGDQPPQQLLWQGEPSKPVWIPLSQDKLGPGPAAIPITLTSEIGARDYVLFIPLLSRLGEKAKTAPAAHYDGAPLRAVLADYSALTGLIILAERPTDTQITGELSPVAPGVALQRLAADNNLVVQQEGDLAFTLTHGR